MAKMFGFIGNRPDLGAAVLRAHAQLLAMKNEGGKAVGWGFGFFQSGEVLLRRRPVDTRPLVDFSEAMERLRTDALIAHVRHPTAGELRTENTHPFRYRGWLFAHTGTLPDWTELRPRVTAMLPEFLRRNVRGDTDSEHLFHLFLAQLHEASALTDDRTSQAQLRAAVRSTVEKVDELCGRAASTGDWLLTDGNQLVAVHRGPGPLAYQMLRGAEPFLKLLDPAELERAPIPKLESSHFVLVASELTELSAPWVSVAGPSVAFVSRTAEPVVEPL